jgi:hypothetical protein
MGAASRFAVFVLCAAGCDASPPALLPSTLDLSVSGPGRYPDGGFPDLAFPQAGPEDLYQAVHDFALPPDMSGITVGTPTFNCTTDNLPDGGPTTQSVWAPVDATDLIGLCDGWTLVADHDQKQLGFFNPVTHESAPPIPLEGSPGRLAFDEENALVYATLSPDTKIAKIDLTTGAVHYISGEDAAMLAIGNNGQVLGVNITPNGPPRLTVFDGRLETITARIDLSGSTDGTLIAFDRARNLVVTGASGATGVHPWYSDMNRFAYDPQSATVALQESVSYVAINGFDLRMSPDGLHTVFPCGHGNDGAYSLFDFHTDDFTMNYGTWSIGLYPVSAAFSPDGRFLAATDTMKLAVWDASTYTMLTQANGCYYSGSPQYQVAYSRGGGVAFLLTSGCYRINGVNVGLLTYLLPPP